VRVKLRLFISGQRGFVARLQSPKPGRGGAQFIQIDRFGNVDNFHTAQSARGNWLQSAGGGAGITSGVRTNFVAPCTRLRGSPCYPTVRT